MSSNRVAIKLVARPLPDDEHVEHQLSCIVHFIGEYEVHVDCSALMMMEGLVSIIHERLADLNYYVVEMVHFRRYPTYVEDPDEENPLPMDEAVARQPNLDRHILIVSKKKK